MSIISFYLFFVSVIIINKKYGIDGYRKIQTKRNNNYGIKSGTGSREKNVWLQLCAGSGVHVL